MEPSQLTAEEKRNVLQYVKEGADTSNALARRTTLLRRARAELMDWYACTDCLAIPGASVRRLRSIVAEIDAELVNDEDPAPSE